MAPTATDKASMQPSDSTTHFITTPFGEEILYEANRDAFDRTGSDALFRRQFGQLLKAEDTLYVIIGTDSGLLPRWILDNGPPAGSRYLFVELPELFDAVAERLADILPHPQVALTRPDQLHRHIEPFHFSDYAYIERLEQLASFAAMDAHIPEYRTVGQSIEQELVIFERAIQTQLGNQVFIQRQIENLADNLLAVEPLKDCFKDRDAVLLGGGPSLDELLPWIEENRDNLLVIAVSRIARQLLAKKIHVDVVVSVDPHPVSFDVSKEMLELSPDTLFLNAYHVSPLLLGQWHGDAVYCGNKFPWKTKLNTTNMSSVGPTVTNTALAFAVHAGCSRVILAGVDLCFDRGGFTHASGSNERNAGPRLGNLGSQLMTNGGWMADTRPAYVQAAQNLDLQAKSATAQGCEVVNPAAGAARLNNVRYLPLEDLALKPGTGNAHDALRRNLPPRDDKLRQRILGETARELANVNGRLRSMEKLAKEALEANAKLFGRHGGEADFKHKKRMDKIEKQLDREFKDLSPLVKNFGARDFLRLSRPDHDRDWSDEEVERWGEQYYKIYSTTIGKLLDHIADAQARVISRQQELSTTPDFDLLFAQWDKDKTPGRARLWQERHPAALADCSPAIRQRLDDLQQQYRSNLAEQDTAQARRCKEHRSLKPIRSKLLQLYQHANHDELLRHAEILGNDSSPEAAELQALALGYMAELAGEQALALGHYNHILEQAADSLDKLESQEHNPRLEDALRRMSVITLQQNDMANALMVLDVLSALSPVYEPQYAELLRLAGRVDEAVHLYTHYLERAPGDLAAMLKLGKLFHDAGIAESALWAYDYVLQKDPDNKAAQQLRGALTEAPSTP